MHDQNQPVRGRAFGPAPVHGFELCPFANSAVAPLTPAERYQ
jgi:hypothetical protein